MKFFCLTLSLLLYFIHFDLFAGSDVSKDSPGKSTYFEGLSVVGSVGYSGIKLVTERSGIKPLAKTNYGADGVATQLKVSGNLSLFKMALIGLEGYGQYNSAQTKNTFFETVTSSRATERTFSLKWNLGVDAKIGIAPLSTGLVFVYGGPDWGYYDFKYITNGVNSKHSQFKFGGLLGGGIQQLIARHWIIQVTFDYRWYGSKTYAYANGEIQKIKARLATALATFGYRF